MKPSEINSLFMASRFYDVIAFIRISEIMLEFFIIDNGQTWKYQF